ncbi:MAG: ClbS/DfsB family four-helix bundle protein [Candidatus Eisenbacteria bacterium]|nr:ClbS/DfsB family four-helix bundle protein [Candidatus Eisenbacteria bacterium]
MTKEELLARVKESCEAWNALVGSIDHDKISVVVEDDGRTLKDVIAHIAWYQREVATLLRTHVLSGSELWKLSPEARNATITEANRHRPLDAILAETLEVRHALAQALNGMEEEDLHDPGRFKNMPSDWIPWQIVAQNTYEHCDAHSEDIRRVLGLGGE